MTSSESQHDVPLHANEIHLWLTEYNDSKNATLHDAYRGLLSSAERDQEPKFYFPKDRRRYLLTRALVRTVLSRYCNTPPHDLTFSKNSYGRPQVDNPKARALGLSFNISHTYGLIVLGVARQRAIGVDVENVRERQMSIDLANRYFAPSEAIALSALPAPQQQDRFFDYWTLKESYIKARGMGLSLPLDQFGFSFPSDERIQIAIASSLTDDPTRWQFWQLQPKPEYIIAICAERRQPTSLFVRQAIPMLTERTLVPRVLRSSELMDPRQQA